MSKQTIVLSKLSGELHQDLHLLKKIKKITNPSNKCFSEVFVAFCQLPHNRTVFIYFKTNPAAYFVQKKKCICKPERALISVLSLAQDG